MFVGGVPLLMEFEFLGAHEPWSVRVVRRLEPSCFHEIEVRKSKGRADTGVLAGGRIAELAEGGETPNIPRRNSPFVYFYLKNFPSGFRRVCVFILMPRPFALGPGWAVR